MIERKMEGKYCKGKEGGRKGYKEGKKGERMAKEHEKIHGENKRRKRRRAEKSNVKH